jgi:hypothetical protein
VAVDPSSPKMGNAGAPGEGRMLYGDGRLAAESRGQRAMAEALLRVVGTLQAAIREIGSRLVGNAISRLDPT